MSTAPTALPSRAERRARMARSHGPYGLQSPHVPHSPHGPYGLQSPHGPPGPPAPYDDIQPARPPLRTRPQRAAGFRLARVET